MTIITAAIEFQTRGHAEVHEITQQVAAAIKKTGLQAGTVTLFCPSSTSGLTTIEYEPGCVSDFQRLFDEVAPPNQNYKHHERWGDGNGHSHVRAALLGPSLTVPFVDGRLTLGTWQQIIHLDFDNKPRRREVVVQISGE